MKERSEVMKMDILTIVLSVLFSILTTKIMSAQYIKIIENYTNDIAKMTKDFVTTMEDKIEEMKR